MLDKTLPYYGVIMIKKDLTTYPKYTLPEGYRFSMYQHGYEKSWADIEASVGEFGSIQDALNHFNKEFSPYPHELQKRCLFVQDKDGKFVATTTGWYGNHLSHKPLPRIHWVAVKPEHQGKGLAKALLTRTLDILNELNYNDIAYLTTQTWSYAAINLYLSLGFKPYMGAKPANWTSKNFYADNKKAWEIIFDKLGIKSNL